MDSVEQAAEILRQTEKALRELVAKAVDKGEYTNVLKIASWAKGVQEMLGGRMPPILPIPSRKKKPINSKNAIEYPRFFRNRNLLVRIAWSKSKKSEYQHKAPHSVVLSIAEVVSKVGKNGRIFSTEDFLPIKDTEGNEVPSYQVYLVISLLKQVGLIDQHGRQGYSITRAADFKDALQGIWEKLPSK